MYTCQCYSQFFPPSPSLAVSTCPLFKCASAFLPCRQVHPYCFSRFHIYAFIYSIRFSPSDFTLGPSKLDSRSNSRSFVPWKSFQLAITAARINLIGYDDNCHSAELTWFLISLFSFFFLLLSSRLLICQVLSLGLRSVLGEFQGISLPHYSPSEICTSKVRLWSFFLWGKQPPFL